nr:immunoglobulin heavy chain junction region [Macaca mulatta]MOY18444.1 immunoglobulin heavy chain junction region [Macaca mulatta]MOY19273.1 immunoglobulin heavy chain junction region [Macaca mulatta]MOY19588.1 immunoglobulin heavy chain junction region [Macaca mulatta]MOY20726.1 immunoglobulin heavy chain junction region [Macaca mulatta]
CARGRIAGTTPTYGLDSW